MRIVCEQAILMKYHALVIFEKAAKFEIVPLLLIAGGALWVNVNVWADSEDRFSHGSAHILSDVATKL